MHRFLQTLAALALLSFGGATAQIEKIVLLPYADGLSGPIGVVGAPDDSGALFVIEQEGRIRLVDGDGTVAAGSWLDISQGSALPLTCLRGERGLLGLAFHPDYDANGYIFIHYTSADPGSDSICRSAFESVLQRVTVIDGVPDLTTRIDLLRFPQPFGNHNAGDIHFGPDGMLYMATGDGGNAGDPLDQGQDVRTLLGGMLRLDVDATGAKGLGQRAPCGDAINYGIPSDNPDFGPGSCAELWAIGLRNPYRFSFDAGSGDLWIGDVGQDRLEEIDRIPAGAGGLNLGWDCREADTAYGQPGDPGLPSPVCAGFEAGDFHEPVLVYDRSVVAPCYSVTGGFVYRGPDRVLDGHYIAADFCSGDLFVGVGSGDDWDGAFQPGAGQFTIAGFGEGRDDVLFAADRMNGEILRVVADRLFLDGGFEE